MPEIGAGKLSGILSYILDLLVKYNPYLNLYYNPVSNTVMKTCFNEYVNYVHQIYLFTDIIIRKNVRLMIGDEVGLGKTVEAIRIMKYLVQSGLARRILIIAPKSVVRQWIYNDLQDLFYAPGIIELINRNRIHYLMQRIEEINRSRELKIFIGSMDLIKYSEADARGSTRFRPYYEFINNIEWDLIIIDEAHRLGFTPSSRRSLRTHRLAPICKKVPHILLLSATPSRGTHRDFIGRLSLVIPEIEKHKHKLLHDGFLRNEFYRAINNCIFYRRTKEYINQLENKEIFPKLSVYIGLVRLGKYRILYEKLDNLLVHILRSLEDVTNNLLKVLLIKRALSSPYAFLKTLIRVINRRATAKKPHMQIIDPYLIDEKIEQEIDSLIENNLCAVKNLLPSNVRREIMELLNGFEKLYREGDPGVLGLVDLINKILDRDIELPDELIGDILIFSEYLDTVDYIYNIIIERMSRKGFIEYNFVLDKIVNELFVQICPDKPSLCRGTRRKKIFNSLINSSILLGNNSKYLFLLKLSSKNYDIIPIIKPMIRYLKKRLKDRVLCVLISTDVAGEGLNLEVFNIVINYDVPWSPIKREQRIGRVYRLRQKRKCVAIDLVRDTTLEYFIYSKLLTKLLNLTEQHISSYPVEALLILKPYSLKEQVVETAGLTEVDIVSSVAKAISSIDYLEESILESLLDMVFKELVNKVRELRRVLEDINKELEPPERIIDMLRMIYGVSYHEEVVEILRELYKVIYNAYPPTNDISHILVDIVREIDIQRNNVKEKNVLLIDDPDIEMGIVTSSTLKLGDRVILRTPIMVLKKKNGGVEKHVGFEALRILIDYILNNKIRVLEPEKIIDLNTDELLEESRHYTRFIETMIRSRISHKYGRLYDLGLVRKNFSTLRPTIEVDSKNYSIIISSSSFDQVPEEKTLSEKDKIELERLSTEIIISELVNMGCEILEIHFHEKHPYDLLVECPDKDKSKKLMVEIKSHRKRVLKGILTEKQTEIAEKHPWKYLVCIVAGLEKPENTLIYCDYYARIPKEFIEVKRAIVGPG